MANLWKVLATALAAIVVGCSWTAAAASDYPNRDVTLVVPFAAGSGTDLMARLLAASLAKKLGRPVIVDNRPGANGILASQHVARAAADGYTLLLGGNTTHAANPHLSKDLKYDPERDFTPISRLTTAGAVLVAFPKITSLKDLLNEASQAPGKLTYGAPNAGSQIATEMIKRAARVDITRVPYRSTPQAMSDVIAGNISMTFLDVASALPNVRGGQLRALAITSADRAHLMPEIPTFQELGFNDLSMTYWIALFGPQNLSAEIVGILDNAVQQILTDASTQNRLRGLGLEPAYLPARSLPAFVKTELDVWGKLVRDAGLEVN